MAMKYWLFKNKTEAILSKSSKTSFPSETQTNYLLHDPPDGGTHNNPVKHIDYGRNFHLHKGRHSAPNSRSCQEPKKEQ